MSVVANLVSEELFCVSLASVVISN